MSELRMRVIDEGITAHLSASSVARSVSFSARALITRHCGSDNPSESTCGLNFRMVASRARSKAIGNAWSMPRRRLVMLTSSLNLAFEI
jgi:hypothetical protein